MHILFADRFDPSRLANLTDAGHTVTVDPALNADTLPEAMSGVDVLIVRSTKVTSAAIAAADQLALIIRAGAGVDTIDRQAAANSGIYVCNVPGQNAIAVAELAMSFLLALDRHVVDATVELRAGQWNKAKYTQANGIYGQHLAIIGLGDIGLALAERAKSFGMTVSAQRKATRSPEVEQRIRSIGIRMVDSQADLLHDADVVSVHVPSNSETRHLVDADFLGQMRDNTILLNTSRGNVVDEQALLDALDNRGMRAGLDVFADEPGSSTGEFTSALAAHPSVVGNHHVGASTNQAQAAVADGTIAVIEDFAAGQVANCVNMATFESSNATLAVRHLDQVGVLAKVFAALRAGGINVQQMSNQVFVGGVAAVATIHLGGNPTELVLTEIRAIDEVLAATIRSGESA